MVPKETKSVVSAWGALPVERSLTTGVACCERVWVETVRFSLVAEVALTAVTLPQEVMAPALAAFT